MTPYDKSNFADLGAQSQDWPWVKMTLFSKTSFVWQVTRKLAFVFSVNQQIYHTEN